MLQTSGSRRREEFHCQCGQTIIREIRNKALTCGRCELFHWKNSQNLIYGFLELISDRSKTSSLSSKAVWKCSCGQIKSIVIKSVLYGLTKSCGLCGLNRKIKTNNLKGDRKFPFDHWKLQFPNLIGPVDGLWSRGSSKICNFLCSCGKNYELRFFKYSHGKSTCRKCHDVSMNPGDSIGNFIYSGNSITVNSKSESKAKFKCKCGLISMIRIRDVFEKTSKCSKCNTKPWEWWESQRFGRLRAVSKSIETFSTKSELMSEWSCVCGGSLTARIVNVTSGATNSCGSCRVQALEWHKNNHEILKSITFPALPQIFPVGGPKPLEIITSALTSHQFLCWLCGRKYRTKFRYIIDGASLSCGCMSGKISKSNFEIHSFMQSLGLNAKLEFCVEGRSFDVGIPSIKLLIDHDGLKWHSSNKPREKDISKRLTAESNGWTMVSIFEDEWTYKKEIFKNLLKTKAGLHQALCLRPSQCRIQEITSKDSSPFFDKFHYIGRCPAKHHIGVFYEEKLIACASFRKPSRQSIKYEWEISRMASDPDYKIHGIWSKIMNTFHDIYLPKSMVSYSDKRLFSGKVYEQMGFINDGCVKPDYYWTKGLNRYHKSGLRKESESITENELRFSQGYKKIWDSGKIRWVWQSKKG